MFGYDSNFTMFKNLALATISKCDAITCCVILLKGCEHFLFSDHIIGTPTIKHPTCSAGGVGVQK
jgi:hypothetical protein